MKANVWMLWVLERENSKDLWEKSSKQQLNIFSWIEEHKYQIKGIHWTTSTEMKKELLQDILL